MSFKCIWQPVLGLLVFFTGPVFAQMQAKIDLRERVDSGRVIRTAGAMTAEGNYLLDPTADPKSLTRPEELKPESLKVQVTARMVVQDRWKLSDAAAEASSNVLMAQRFVELAEVSMGGQIRSAKTALAANRKRFLVDLQDEMVRQASLDGPVSRQDLETITMPCDGTTLWTLLPREPVAAGDSYRLDKLAAKSISLFDLISVNELEGTIDKIDATSVTIKIKGSVRGAVLGAEGKMNVDGQFTFNRENGFVDFLRLERDESRRPGSVEAGLDIHSTLEIRRSILDQIPQQLSEKELESWPRAITPALLKLVWQEPSGLFSLEHDRDWHTTWTDVQESVIKRVDRGGVVIAQCNLKKGNTVQKGHHQDPVQFREDVQAGLKERFRKFFGEGTLDRPAESGFGYKLAAEGVIQDLPVAWYYYLMASPEGDQYLMTVTSTLAEFQSGNKESLQFVESLRWLPKSVK
ncbi:MAG: hypothetical protein ACKOEM_15730 [Planctomycetia bacterium]